MAKSKEKVDEKVDETPVTPASSAAPKVTLFNRTRAEITLESPDTSPIEYEVAGRPGEGGCVTIPGTPRYSLTPTPVVLDAGTWDLMARRKAVQAMVDAGQIEVR